MRFSLATLSCWSLLAACASGLAPSPPATPAAPPNPLDALSVEELQHREFAAPEDPQIKLALARQAWCRGERGLALESWQWVSQFSLDADATSQSQRYLQSSSTELDDTLGCSKPPVPKPASL